MIKQATRQQDFKPKPGQRALLNDPNGPTERARRIIQGYTAYSVAKASGVSLTTVQGFQVHDSNPSAEYVHRMLAAVGEHVILGEPPEDF